MFKSTLLIKIRIYLIPAIILIWSFFLNNLSGPFFLSVIDPEYPYLLNGLNCALFDFIRIGHTDHPGTPFQLITGLFIHITYWTVGEGSMVEDVISRPELYLKGASFLLSLLTAGIILWIGKIVLRKSNNLLGAVILQASLFLSTVLINMSSRYIPDRLLAIYVLIFIGLCYKYYYQDSYKSKKFAMWSGILMGVGFITKFNFLPLLIVPVIIIDNKKDRLSYAGYFIVSAIISFLPVYDKFSHFRGFIINIITHDGLHGTGSEQVFNLHNILHNSTLIFQNNTSFSFVFISALALLIFLILKKDIRKNYLKEFLFLLAFIVVTVISVVMVSKHFKNYYLIPVMSLTGFIFYILWKISRDIIKFKQLNKIFTFLLIVLVLIPAVRLYPYYITKKQRIIEKRLTVSFVKNNISPADYLILKPVWLPGPFVQNGLVYGVSYVGYRHYFYNDYEKFYPNLLTWEGENKPIQYFRMIDADIEAILKSGKNIYLYSAPHQNAKTIINYLNISAHNFGVSLLIDTVFVNSNNYEYLIKISNNDDWKTINEGRCGFEKVVGNKLVTDNENMVLRGRFRLSNKKVCNGLYALKLSNDLKTGPKYIINNVSQGDYIEITIKRRKNKNEEKGEIVLCANGIKSDSILKVQSSSLSSISSKWQILRLSTEIKHQPANGTLSCYYRYEGDDVEYLDDFSFRLLSRK